MKTWVRLYTEVLDDPKIQRLSSDLVKFWVNCLCMAGRFSGILPSESAIAWFLRTPETQIHLWKKELLSTGLLEIDVTGNVTPHAWNERQYETPKTPAERVRKHREKKRLLVELKGEVTQVRNASVSECNENRSVSVLFCSDSVNVKPEKETTTCASNVASRYREFLDLWQAPLPSGKVFTCSDVDLGCQIWISLCDSGSITEANISEVFAGLGRHKVSQKWREGFVLSVPAFLGYAKNGTPSAPRWNDRPTPADVEDDGEVHY